MAKLLCTDHEELYNNILKPRIKLGNDFVTQDEVSTSMQPAIYCQMCIIAPSGFILKLKEINFFFVFLGSTVKRHFGVCNFTNIEEVEVAVRECMTSYKPHFSSIIKQNGILEILP